MNRNFVFPLIMILVFAMAARTPIDSDMWWHLRAGEESLHMGKPMTVDTFSYTRYGEEWINHSWLFKVGMYFLFQLGSFLALGAMVSILAVLSMGLVYAQMEGTPLQRAFILVLVTMVAAMVWSPRPQMPSLVLFALLGYLLYLFKWQQRDYLWALVPIFILWSNLHGGYFVGLLLIGSMIGGEVLNHALGFEGKEIIPWKGIGRLIFWAVVGGLVVVINPNGLAMWSIPFRTVGLSVWSISEWASPDFHEFVQQPFLWLLFATLGSAGISRRRLDGSDLVAVVGFAYMAFIARRNYGLFALVAAPIFSRHLYALIQNWGLGVKPQLTRFLHEKIPFLTEFGDRSFSPNVQTLLNIIIIALLAMATIVKLYIVTSPELVSTNNQKFFPVHAVEWIKINKPAGRMFNEYNWGGYLIWELRDYPVFVDGRTDIYDNEFLREYLTVVSGDSGWEAVLDDFGVNLVLVEKDSGLTSEIQHNLKWTLGYEDDLAMIYLRQR